MTLYTTLTQQNKTKWLDIGSGGNYEDGFFLLDVFPKETIRHDFRDKYIECNIVKASSSELSDLGKWDLVRLQHVFEHFNYEDGLKVLDNCANLLSDGGIILLTVPDLQIHVEKYLKNKYKDWHGYRSWASNRIPLTSPSSFYFSMFAHSTESESHKWCYDFAGVKFQLEKSGWFRNIKRLDISNPLASIPFTHNRPDEDLCVIAKKIIRKRLV